MRADIRRIFRASIAAKRAFLREHIASVERVVRLTQEALTAGHTIFFFGNGGSAADAQHLAAEFVNRFRVHRRPLSALALTTDTSALTSIANDLGYQEVFARQLEAFARPGDVAYAISTSGNSPNVLRAVSRCRKLGVVTVALTGGDGGRLARLADHVLSVDSTPETARIQETHILVGHAICELVEMNLAREPVARRRRATR